MDTKIKNSSDHNPCHHFEQGVCKSCNLMGSSVESGRVKKIQSKILEINNLFPNVRILPIFGRDDFRGSRQKAKLACFENIIEGKLALGIYNLTEKISLEDCPLYGQDLQFVIQAVKKYLIDAKVSAYDISNRKGEAKFVLITESLPYHSIDHCTYMVRIVLRSKESVDRIQKLAAEFMKNYPMIKTLSVNIQPEPKAVLEGEEEILIAGSEVFINGYQNQKLNLTIRSFSQINSYVAFHLYDYVKEILMNHQITDLLDLYCGVGGFSLNAQEVLNNVWGVEISKDAVRMANLTAGELGKTEFFYEAGDVEKLIKEKSKEKLPQAVIVNPPRAGLSKATTEFLKNSTINHIVYSSCNPETFMRDAQMLKDNYNLVSLKPFDMFMMTDHFELVGHFYIKNANLAAS